MQSGQKVLVRVSDHLIITATIEFILSDSFYVTSEEGNGRVEFFDCILHGEEFP